MKQPRADYDSPWKEILDVYFENFVSYCWPEKHSEIHWQKGYKSLDKELNKISRNAPIGKRVVDKLIEVYRKDGEPTWVLLHLEVQGSSDLDFEQRMFIYRYRLYDLYRKPIASLAILIDTDKEWRPRIYREELWGSWMEMGFPIIKLIDYQERIAELESSSNPFAIVILAQLAALKKESSEARLVTKVNLTRRLYGKGWQKEDILILYKFLDWVMALPKPLALQYHHEIEKIEENLKVNYITTAERIGIEKGIQQGMQQGERTVLERLLQHKFKEIPENYSQKIEQANTESLLKWAQRVLDSQTLEDVFKA